MTRAAARQQRPPAPPRISAVPAADTAPRRALALIGVVGPLYYVVLVTVLGMLWNGYDPIRDTQSELGAVDAPYRLVMNLVGFFPCDAGCVDVTVTGRLHSLFIMPGAIGLPAAAMVSALVFRRDGRFGMAWQLVSFWLGLVTLLSGPLIAAELVGGVRGLVQRAAMWVPLVWMIVVSIKLYRLARPATAHP
jgi:hypothetical protein